jgi:DNA adenine methylase
MGLQSSLYYRQRRHREDTNYYWLRSKNPKDPIQRASRLIYLNRTCFNGIYRVNRQGQFNVPRGTKDKVLIETDNFEGMSRLLTGAELIAGDFQSLVDRAQKDDFVFADPHTRFCIITMASVSTTKSSFHGQISNDWQTHYFKLRKGAQKFFV